MSTVTAVFLATMGAAIILAVFLVMISQTSALLEKEKKQKTKDETFSRDDFLMQAVFDQVRQFFTSERLARQVSAAATDVFEKELEKRIESNTETLDKKYQSIIKDRSESEDIAWHKYKEVMVEHNKTEAIVRSVAEGLVVVDANDNVIMMNPAAEQLLGVSKKDMMGRPILERVRKEQLLSLAKGRSDKENREIEMASGEDETKKILRSSNAVIEDQKGQTVGFVSVLSDVTREKEVEKVKTNFVSNVTHELRTPLIASQKAVKLLLSKDKDIEPGAETEEFLALAERNLSRLSTLINDLLDISKIEAGKLEIHTEPTYLEEVIDESIAGLKTWAETKSLNVLKYLPKELPHVNIDKIRIGQVMTNLLGNAIKFTPEKGTITITAKSNTATGDVIVSVEDTGVGIEPEHLPKVFDRFYQDGERAPTDISGTGLGLSIAKQIVEMHGGQINAESLKGSGAKFTFSVKAI